MKITGHNIISLITLTSSVFLVACGGSSSNPMDKYPGMQKGPVTNEKPQVQTILKPDLFIVDVEGTNQVNTGNFIEGQASEVLFKVTTKSSLVKSYNVEMTDFSNIERPVLVATNEANIYSLKWTPAAGTIASGQWGKVFKAQIQITVTDASAKDLVGVASTRTLDVIVSRNNSVPKITGRTDLSKGVEEGQNVSFTVDVVDPASASNPRLPEVQITPYIYANTEAYRADASHYLAYDDSRTTNPEKISATTYRFYYTMRIDNLPLDRDRLGHEIPAASSVDLCFQMRAVSVVGTLSESLQVCTKARYAAQPPVITLTDSEGKEIASEVKAGSVNTLNLKISSEHPLSAISTAKPELLIANLKGSKEISCSFDVAGKKNSETCVIKWTPSCISKTEVTNLTVKADSTLGSKSKSSSISKTINVVPDLDACPVVKPAVKSAPVVKPAVKGGK